MLKIIGMLYVKLCGHKWSNPKKLLTFIFSILLTCLGFAAAGISLLDMLGVIDLADM